jgi:gliding motility-associated-like protein
MGGEPISTINAVGLVAGQTYYILVDGYGGNQCPYTIDVISGTIQPTATILPPPSVIFGPTTLCASATKAVFSVPKALNVTDYVFTVTNLTTNTPILGVQTDSSYTITNLPATGMLKVCVLYKNDCTQSVPTCSTVDINTTVNINLPTAYLCPGSFYTLPDGLVVNNNAPPTTDQTQGFTASKPGTAGCDTTFNVTVVSYALREGNRIVFLKPAESVAICNTTITGAGPGVCARRDQVVTCVGAAVNGCDSIVNTLILNANQTSNVNPLNPVLNCSSATLTVTHANTCTTTTGHSNKYQWFYQAVANGPLTNLNNITATHNASTAGIYVLEVRDSVFSRVAGFPGYRIITDTIRSTVSGNGSAGSLATPSAINGRIDTTICQGAITTFKINKVPNATSYRWYFARNGGTILGASNDTSIVVQWANNTAGDTVYVRAKNVCDSSIAQKIAVIVINFANIDAGPDRTVCGLQTALAGVSSTGAGRWTAISAAGGIFTNDALPTTNVTVASAGLYKFVWTEISNTCTKSDTVNITFGTPPQYTSFRDSCNVARTNFFVKFSILGGTAPFTVVNSATMLPVGSVNAAGLFSSNALPVGAYNLQIKDANMCVSTLIPAAQTCTACFTKSGIMDTTTALSVCEGDSARGTYLGGYFSDGNDTLQFVLHTGNPKTGIVQRANAPRFGFKVGMTYETTYYISAIAGDDSLRSVKLTDACFSASSGVAVVFHKKPTASFTVDAANICLGDCTNLRYTFTGNAPFSVRTNITDPFSRDTTITSRQSSFIVPICPTGTTNTYRLVSVSDTFGCSTIGLTQQVIVRTVVPIDAGTPRPPLSICSGIDTTVNLLTQLIGALQGGVWSETSTIRSTGTAFSAALGSFRTINQVAGTYRFSYVVKQVVGSPCPADTANVTLILLPAPIANAGPNDTITCDKTTIDLGGANTSAGAGITYMWSGGNAGGNASNITVTEPGTYYLKVVSPTCTSRDTVVVLIDTAAPRAIISPLAVKTLTCKLDSIRLNGSTSTPLGKISYIWVRGNQLYDNNPITEVRNGDLYGLAVRNNKNGCISTDTIRVLENRTPPKVVITTPPTVNCKDSVVTIDASTSSSGVPYVLKWVTANGGKILRDSTTLKPKTKTAGFYELTVRDTANGCVSTQFAFVKVDTIRPFANANALDTLDCSNPTVGLSGRGSTLGATMTYTWVARPGHLTSSESTLNANADEPGVYILTVENSKNFCNNSDTAVVIRNTERPRSAKITIKKPSCYGECDANFKIDTVSGGTKPFLYSTDGKVFTTRNLFQNQCAGTFKLYIQDAGGCQIDTTFSINQDKQIAVSLGADTTIKLGDSLILRVQTNADSVKNITWSPVGDSTKCPKGGYCTEQTVLPTVGTTYTATVTNKNGCSAIGKVRVSIDKRRPIFVPNIFAPDNSGKNDILMIFGSSVVKIIKRFQIYDRWGNLMLTQQNFKTDDPAYGWDGRLRGRNALPDVYVYFIEVEYQDKTTEIIEGDFTLIR